MLNVSPAQAGMTVIGWLPQNNNDIEVGRKLNEQGVLVAPMSVQYNQCRPRQGLHLGFGCTPVEKVQPAVQKMTRVLVG
jgi:GntR family transcriptional regulator/MocR family aminotransferase